MDDLKKLKAEYQQAITNLHSRRMELQTKLNTVHGKEYRQMQKRIACLYEEEGEMVYALRILARE